MMAVARTAAVRSQRQERRKPSPVQVIRVNSGVLREALKIAGGDASRIRIISTTRVEVMPC
jgi:hypothetical protein